MNKKRCNTQYILIDELFMINDTIECQFDWTIAHGKMRRDDWCKWSEQFRTNQRESFSSVVNCLEQQESAISLGYTPS